MYFYLSLSYSRSYFRAIYTLPLPHIFTSFHFATMAAEHHRDHSPQNAEEREARHKKWEQMRHELDAEMKQEFFQDFKQKYGDGGKVTADQAWELIEANNEKRHKKKEERRSKHGWGPGGHHRGGYGQHGGKRHGSPGKHHE